MEENRIICSERTEYWGGQRLATVIHITLSLLNSFGESHTDTSKA